MTIDPSELRACAEDIFRDGIVAFVTHTIKPVDIEAWVRKVAATSGQPVDWHYYGGRAVVRTTGDLKAVKAAILDHKAEHDRLYAEAAEQILGGLP
jgi:hypothetical protein